MSGKKIKISRVEKDLTQSQLAEKIGVTRQTIGLIENDNYNPSIALCIKMAKALGKTLNDLFWEEEGTK
ncbi:helix-turn-helix transcriptional regulator [Clostridium sp. SHJSY1]|uniref:helix-turn-helix transcriptional regulator n=1 Tax=Clostridium sp. SHJSY1 TaxID=2942483 RepID=UPI002876FABA|nr:helix-turn-helix transcriptional regulator [Clostridium sp. SHJSY1]MDS0528036.1 helix-turn-helix transcriptional regulator [Clostridium sp. SHJSY1]